MLDRIMFAALGSAVVAGFVAYAVYLAGGFA